MKYALVLETCSETCNATSSLLASMGYLITPVFNPRKALHAAHMIQFDLIVACTATIPGDRRSLTGELARCAPDAAIIYLADAGSPPGGRGLDGAHAVAPRPLNARHIGMALERMADPELRAIPAPMTAERRRRAVD
jgi:hypothetical protein